MKRIVEPELLDELPTNDPGAIGSRRDLRRLNAWMGHAAILADVLAEAFSRHLSFRLVELGAGEAVLLWNVAKRLEGKWRSVDATLVDRQDVFIPELEQRFAGLRWRVRHVTSDVFDWLNENTQRYHAIMANLFLHQFSDGQLRALFERMSRQTDLFVCLEPRRWRPALFGSRLVGLAGCNAVTRHDAVVSVKAGFAGRELSALWPDAEAWNLTEQPANWTSHLFVAKRPRSCGAQSLQ